jgi:vesicle transport protein SEC22
MPCPCAAVAQKSSSLRQASSKYSKDAKYLNTQALLRKYAPVAVVTVLVGGALWWRFF